MKILHICWRDYADSNLLVTTLKKRYSVSTSVMNFQQIKYLLQSEFDVVLVDIDFKMLNRKINWSMWSELLQKIKQ